MAESRKHKRLLTNIKAVVTNRKVQLTLAIMLTLALVIGYPTYSWFSYQRQLARYEKISTPNSLYITAARREDSKNIEIDNIDVNAFWYDSNGTADSRVYYQDYVFSVAGDYVTSYTLQLAHTTNNNYTYEIFEAQVYDSAPAGIKDKNYVEYTLTEKYDPTTMSEITANPVYDNKGEGDKLYYSVRKDDNGANISLNGSGTTYQLPNLANVTASRYTIGSRAASYKGHYLNWASQFAALGSGDYHTATYGSNATVGPGGGTNVQTHAEPLYWQANEIPVDGATTRDPFYHEYILRVSWTNDGASAATATYKDTDMVYITVKAD